MKRRIEKKPRFRVDLLNTFVYIAEHNLDAGVRFLQAVQEACLKLSDMPGMGAKREFADDRLRDIRSWPVRGFEKYLIFYRPVSEGIEFLRIVHGARDIEHLFD